MKQLKFTKIITQLLCFTAIIFISITNSWTFNANNKSNAKNLILIDQNGKRTIRAVPLTDEIKIDNRLDEATRETAKFARFLFIFIFTNI